MTRYMITYFGGNQPSTPEEGQKHFAEYKAWLASLGDAAISPMNPLKNTATIDPYGSVTTGSTSKMSGYTVVEAESIEAAIAMAKGCPFLKIEGTLEVAEMVQMG